MLIKVVGMLLEVLAFYIGDRVLFDAAAEARISIFNYVQELDFAFHSSKSTGSLISAFKRGDSAFFTLYHVVHVSILKTLVSFLVMLYFFSRVNGQIAVWATVSLIVTLVVTKFLISINVAKRSRFNREEDEVSSLIIDNLIGFETVKLFAKEDWELGRLRDKFIPWKKALWAYANSFRLIDLGVGGVINLTILVMLLVSLRAAVGGTLGIGDFVLIVSFLSFFFDQIWNLVWNLRDLAKNYADIQKYFGLLQNQVLVKDNPRPVQLSRVRGEIEFKNVSFSYKGGTKNAVRDVNLKIAPGESLALVGKSGSGKTTLFKLLMRFYDPEKGRIAIDGININRFKKTVLRGFFGVVPQEPILFNNTIAYNIGYGKGSAVLSEVEGSVVEGAAKLANIDDFIESLPDKYESHVGERGIKLSGGQKQRLAIARMILSDPDIIIFDEATSQLDSESERLIQEAFWKASRGKTTIIIAHRLSTIMRADRIVVMEKGKIIEEGTHQSLLENKNGIYKRLWDLQINLEAED